MKSFDSRTYNIADFLEWRDAGLLQLSPDFQRRSVWSLAAKSYLIDTILRGKPMHKVFITQTLVGGRGVRTVVDGQQRLRAILGFRDGDFAISRVHNAELANRRWDDLDEQTQSDFLQYEIAVDLLFDMTLADTLDVFARLNTYSVKLNQTELLNANYLGSFKTAAHGLGHSYAEYWIESKVLTNAKVTRMAEVELAADLLGSLLEGLAPKKAVPGLYKKYDEAYDAVAAASTRFDLVMSAIGDIYAPEDLAGTNFTRVHLFYSLFTSVATILFGTPRVEGVSVPDGFHLRPSRARAALDDVSSEYDIFTEPDAEPGSAPRELNEFITASRRGTTDLGTRIIRSRYLLRRMLEQ